MNKAVPWMSRSAGPNAHDAARRAARREGKSLGEWLRDTIVDHAEDFDGSEDDGTGHGRVANVTARLERLGASEAGLSRRPLGPGPVGSGLIGSGLMGPGQPGSAMPRRSNRDVADDGDRARQRPSAESPRRWREPVSPEDIDAFLDEAIDSIERRASDRERRAGAVLSSFATIMEISEVRRREEEQAVGSLSQKLADLESKLASRNPVGVQNPMKGALARIDARLDMLDAKDAAGGVAAANVSSFGGADDGTDAIRRLEDKLNSILDAVGGRAAQPSVAETSPIALDAARNAASVLPRRSLAAAIGEISRRQRVLDEPELANRDRRSSEPSAKQDASGTRSGEPLADNRLLEELVRELGTKIEAVHAPSTDERALEALQAQVQRLSQRFELSEQGLSALPTLASSVRDLFEQLESTRESVEASATHAAREVLRIAAKGGRSQEAVSASEEFALLKDIHHDADHRTKSTLDAVHEMLTKVVDRLATVEGDLNDLRREPDRPAVQPAAKATAETRMPNLAFAAMDMPRDPIVPASAKRIAASGEEGQHADFIAAARRAAKVARAEPSLAALQRPPGKTPSEKEARAGLLAKSRDYVATHKRPVLMGIAAILMVLGTITILQRMEMGAGRTFASEDQSAAKIAQLDRPPVSKPPARNVAGIEPRDLSPSELPKAAAPLAKSIPGSDPIQTGSIPRLPAFAAQGGLGPSTQAALPAGLKAAAAAGNGAAEYDLGVHYADGVAVPRDLKVAAQWFAKAADQGLAPAKYRLASMFEKGLGVSQDKARAKSLYTQAADAGNPRAMHNLAVLLADGDGHPDYGSAAIWFRKAAAYGIHDSQYNLAILLARGLGVQQSLVQSYQWLAIAAAQNDADAAHKRDEVGAKLSANDLAVAKALAAAFKPKTAAPEANEVEPPSTGWDGVVGASHLNSAKSKVSSL